MANFMIETRPDRDQYHTKTRTRIEYLTGKECEQCGESRLKSMLRQKDGTVSCYNCKKHNKVYAYETSGIMHKNTRMHYDEISALGARCHNTDGINRCCEMRPKALQVITYKGQRLLLCHNCDRYNKNYLYETY